MRKNTPKSARSLFIEPQDNTGPWRIGTSGWSYPLRSGPGSWTGVFYPLTKTDELQFYARYFNAVEINSTFYRPCNPKTAESWARRTPDEFEFTVKAWQEFTHRQAPPSPAALEEFKQGIAPLKEAGKLGCILFQFPTSFHCDDGTRDLLRALLDAFAEFEKAVELRHRSWDDYLEILEEFAAVPAFIDEPKFRDSIRQTIQIRRSMLYMRFHGRKAEKWWRHEHRNERYDYLYSSDELAPYAVRLQEIVSVTTIRRAYIFFNNHPNAKAVANAIMLRAMLGAPVVRELPESFLKAFPQLATRSFS